MIGVLETLNLYNNSHLETYFSFIVVRPQTV